MVPLNNCPKKSNYQIIQIQCIQRMFDNFKMFSFLHLSPPPSPRSYTVLLTPKYGDCHMCHPGKLISVKSY